MRRNVLNFVIDAVTLPVMLAMVGTGLLLRFVLPPGSRGGRGMSLWGWGRHDYGDLHFWLSIGLLALLVVHVALHWSWVCTLVQRVALGGPPAVSVFRRHLAGVATIAIAVLLVGGFLFVAARSVATSGGDEHRDHVSAGAAAATLAAAGTRGP